MVVEHPSRSNAGSPMLYRLNKLRPSPGSMAAAWANALRWLAALCAAVCVNAAASEPVDSLLVLYSNGRLLPANVAGDQGLRAELQHPSLSRRIVIYDEFLDTPRFVGDDHERRFAHYLQGKYADRPPSWIVAAGPEALRFLLAQRATLFSRTPVLTMGVRGRTLDKLRPLPPEVVGSAMDLDFLGTIETALRLQPTTRRVAVVTGTSAHDLDWENEVRYEVAPRLPTTLEVEFLAGLPNAALKKRLAELPADTVVLMAGVLRDGDGNVVSGRQMAGELAAVSNAPVYTPFDTHVGTGVVGGQAATFEEIGRIAGQSLRQLIEGASLESLALPAKVPTRLIVDWRQVQRWGIDPGTIPDGADVRFKTPSLWEQHRDTVAVAIALLLAQAALIAWLLLERRRRRGAEEAVSRQRQELAHASRLVVAAELTAAIAHEINQPLGAILSNADAAEMILKSGADTQGELRHILSDIRRDDLRASEVIRRWRTLMSKHEVERQPVDLNEATLDTRSLLEAEAQRRRVAIDVRPASAPITVMGDRIQIQQVMINLVVNAMDAMHDVPAEQRRVVVSIDSADDSAAIAVRDQGCGIAAERLPKIFESYFTTKREGMGLGLSVARTLVEAHGGRIWAESALGKGTVFHVRLPATAPVSA
jgi:signal transduction histidine kinase